MIFNIKYIWLIAIYKIQVKIYKILTLIYSPVYNKGYLMKLSILLEKFMFINNSK